jgi:hypothetical protein
MAGIARPPQEIFRCDHQKFTPNAQIGHGPYAFCKSLVLSQIIFTIHRMVDDAPIRDLFFEVPTLLGFSVRVTLAYWQRIVSIKHPTMAGQETIVQETLRQPEEV